MTGSGQQVADQRHDCSCSTEEAVLLQGGKAKLYRTVRSGVPSGTVNGWVPPLGLFLFSATSDIGIVR